MPRDPKLKADRAILSSADSDSRWDRVVPNRVRDTDPLTQPSRMLGVMTKFWQAGEVKTRLAESISSAITASRSAEFDDPSAPTSSAVRAECLNIAAKIHQRLVRHTLEAFDDVPAGRQWVVSPAEKIPDFSRWVESVKGDPAERAAWRVVDQGGGCLGDRITRWFDSHLGGTADSACILIGTDCPLLRASDLEAAWQSLRTHDVVFGPADDGGYTLVGISPRPRSRPWRRLFRSIAWSTDAVLPQSIAAADRAGMAWHLLPERTDIDTLDDLIEVIRTLGAEASVAEASDAEASVAEARANNPERSLWRRLHDDLRQLVPTAVLPK